MKRRATADPQHPTGKRRKIERYPTKAAAQAALAALTQEGQRCTIVCGNGQQCTGKKRITKNGSGKWVVSKHCSKTYKRHSVHGLSKEHLIHKIVSIGGSIGYNEILLNCSVDENEAFMKGTEALAKMPLKQLRDILYSAQEKQKQALEERGLEASVGVKQEHTTAALPLNQELDRAVKVQTHNGHIDHQSLPPRVQLQTDVSHPGHLRREFGGWQVHRLLHPEGDFKRVPAHGLGNEVEFAFPGVHCEIPPLEIQQLVASAPRPAVPHVLAEGHIIVPPPPRTPLDPWDGPSSHASHLALSTVTTDSSGPPSPRAWFPDTEVPKPQMEPIQYNGNHVRGSLGGKGRTLFHVASGERLQYEVPQSWEFTANSSWVEITSGDRGRHPPPHSWVRKTVTTSSTRQSFVNY